MHVALLDLLRCPYCGTALSVVDNSALVRHGDEIEEGLLGCQCCAFPVLEGIPVLVADDATRSAMHALEAGRRAEALSRLLGLDHDASHRARVLDLLASDELTYRNALSLLCHDAEATYLLHRFSDPTFLVAEPLLRAVVPPPTPTQRALDLCGGTGHLTRILTRLEPGEAPLEPSGAPPEPATVLADLYFWKLWLARRFTAPTAAPICCDANAPLPFARGAFASVVLADAFPYIWHKRLLAEEMVRLAGPRGVIVMPHLHSTLGENFSAGDTLTPQAYRSLFDGHHPRLFSDRRMLDDALEDGVIDLTHDRSPKELGNESSFTLVASADSEVFRRSEIVPDREVEGVLMVNPLYRIDASDGASVLTLDFPTPEYEAEFGHCRRYMPERIRVDADLQGPIRAEQLGERYSELREARVVLDVPVGYC